jgi:hypothetical protein
VIDYSSQLLGRFGDESAALALTDEAFNLRVQSDDFVRTWHQLQLPRGCYAVHVIEGSRIGIDGKERDRIAAQFTRGAYGVAEAGGISTLHSGSGGDAISGRKPPDI